MRTQFCDHDRCDNRQSPYHNREETGHHHELLLRSWKSASYEQREYRAKNDQVHRHNSWNQRKVDNGHQRMLGIQRAQDLTVPLTDDRTKQVMHRSQPEGRENGDLSFFQRVMATIAE